MIYNLKKISQATYQVKIIKGGVVLIDITWNCDFDFKSYCFPKYSFRRFDTKGTNTASGFNFRFAHKYKAGDVEYRVFFIYFLIIVFLESNINF